jgi:NADH:ubiquinone oxidoreductase subunit 4 (subunit M)
LYNRVFFGTLKLNYGFYFIDVIWNELLIFIPLTYFMFAFGINSNFILNISYLNIEQLLLYSNLI